MEQLPIGVAEYYYSGREQKRQRTNTQYLQSIQQLTAGKSISAVIVDPSAASFIAELRQAGFLVRKGKNDVVEGIRRTAAALEQGKLLFSPDCKNKLSGVRPLSLGRIQQPRPPY